MFDAQCDLAAIVYTARDGPDRLLLDFVNDLRRAGRRPLGLVQLGRNPFCDSRTIRLLRLPSGEVVSLHHDPASGARQCGLESERLVGTAGALAAAIGAGADLVVINRFGKLEAEGQGADRSDQACGGGRHSRVGRGAGTSFRDAMGRRRENYIHRR
jgi:hypothetical protein